LWPFLGGFDGKNGGFERILDRKWVFWGAENGCFGIYTFFLYKNDDFLFFFAGIEFFYSWSLKFF
jgi:hypothetical protein